MQASIALSKALCASLLNTDACKFLEKLMASLMFLMQQARASSQHFFCAGLLNADDSSFVEKLLEQAAQRFDQALASADRDGPRLLLRIFAALVPANVLHPSSVLNSLCSIVDAALEAASAGKLFSALLHTAPPWAYLHE